MTWMICHNFTSLETYTMGARREFMLRNEAVNFGMPSMIRDPITQGASLEWPRLYSGLQGHYEIEGCDWQNIEGLRVNGTWTVQVQTASHLVNKNRSVVYGYLLEFIRRAGDDSFEAVRHTFRGKGNYSVENSTTTVAYFYYNPAMGYRDTIFFESLGSSGPAGYRKWLKATSETLLASEIAALSFPIVLSIIPISFITEVHTLTLFAYVLFTDILNALPLLFKGAELIHLARNPPISSLTRTYGLDPPWLFGTAYTMLVKCKTRPDFVYIGISFILIAMSSMIIGIFLEIRAYKNLSRRKYGTTQALPGLAPYSKTCPQCGTLFDIIDCAVLANEQNWAGPSFNFELNE